MKKDKTKLWEREKFEWITLLLIGLDSTRTMNDHFLVYTCSYYELMTISQNSIPMNLMIN